MSEEAKQVRCFTCKVCAGSGEWFGESCSYCEGTGLWTALDMAFYCKAIQAVGRLRWIPPCEFAAAGGRLFPIDDKDKKEDKT